MFSDDPTEFLFGILDLQVENVSGGDADYPFREESFFLRTWSGRELAEVHHPGTRRFGGLATGASPGHRRLRASGCQRARWSDAPRRRGPDSPAWITLSGAARPVELPRPLTPVGLPTAHVGPIELDGRQRDVSLDRPGDMPERHPVSIRRGEVFDQLTRRGTVWGIAIGQTRIRRFVRLSSTVWTRVAPFRGGANVPEGKSIDLLLGFLAPFPFEAIEARFTWTDGLTGSVQLALEATP